jgi:hypothetical protein
VGVNPHWSRGDLVLTGRRRSFLESQGIPLHNLAPQVQLNPHFPPPYTDGGVFPFSGQRELLFPIPLPISRNPTSSAELTCPQFTSLLFHHLPNH